MLISTEKVTPDNQPIKPVNELLIADITYELRNYLVDTLLNDVEKACEDIKYPTRARIRWFVAGNFKIGSPLLTL